MSSQPQGNESTGSNHNSHRRASFSPGSTLSEFLSSNRQPAPTTAYPGPITTAAAQANNKRRMSMSSASGNSPPSIQTSFPFRRGSVSSTSSATSTVDESAIDDSEPASGSPTNVGNSPFARRMSWGARALRDVRVPQRNSVAFTPTSPGASSPTVTRGFPENRNAGEQPYLQRRRQSVSVLPPSSSVPSAKEPDHHQERILKGELFMD